jgi:hypothetical protein
MALGMCALLFVVSRVPPRFALSLLRHSASFRERFGARHPPA